MVKRRLGRNVKNQDSELSKIQVLTLDAVGPLTHLIEVSSAEGAESIPVKEVTEVLRTALTLLGSASAHISSLRRRKILAELNPDLQDLTEKDNLFKDAAPLLFGEGFEAVAKEYTEGLNALARAAPNRNFRSHCPGHDLRWGGGPGRTDHYRPYSTHTPEEDFQEKAISSPRRQRKLAKKPKIVSSCDINITNNISGCNIQFFDFKKNCFDQTITSHLSAGMPGVCDQLQKVCPNPNKAGRIPGFSAEFRFGDPKATPGEDKGYSTGCTNPVKAWPLDGQRTLSAAREVKCGHMGDSPRHRCSTEVFNET